MTLVRYFRESCWRSSRTKPQKTRQEQNSHSVHQDTILLCLDPKSKNFWIPKARPRLFKVYASWFSCKACKPQSLLCSLQGLCPSSITREAADPLAGGIPANRSVQAVSLGRRCRSWPTLQMGTSPQTVEMVIGFCASSTANTKWRAVPSFK